MSRIYAIRQPLALNLVLTLDRRQRSAAGLSRQLGQGRETHATEASPEGLSLP